MGHAFAIALGTSGLRYEMGFGLAWATFLTLFDRIIISQSLMFDSVLYRIFGVFLGRGILGVAGALVTSIAAMMFLFLHDLPMRR